PYYIYMADQVAGGEHFRTTVEKGLEIVKALRGRTSGLAGPHFVLDAPGGGHFRTTVEKGLEIVKALRGWTSGLAVPHFVIDAPGGGGKVPLLPEYVEGINDDEGIFRH